MSKLEAAIGEDALPTMPTSLAKGSAHAGQDAADVVPAETDMLTSHGLPPVGQLLPFCGTDSDFLLCMS